MTRWLPAALLAVTLVPAAAQAQVDGFRVEAGAVWLTKSGTLKLGTDLVESDAGWAGRARVRYGFGFLSVAADLQESSQGYGKPAGPGAPQNLDNTWLGAVVALHPFAFGGIAPYVEIGVGRLFYSDQHIDTEHGGTASSYGLGVLLGGESRVMLDVELRLLRQSGLRVEGTVREFEYDPKLLSAMISIRF